MRVALVHSYYSSRQPSGENVVVDAQAAALTRAGHDVHVVARRTDDVERRPIHAAQAAWTVATGIGTDPTDELRRFRPDVVHVHNLFPNIGTRWLARWDGPLVATLHNFRPMCAAGTLYRDGKVCTACPDGDATAAVRHGCYRGSKVATLPLVVAHRGGLLNDPVVHRADALVLLTQAAAAVYRTYGVDSSRLHVVPNFVDDPYGGAPTDPVTDAWVFVGRLSPEKGVGQLLANWRDGVPLDVYGDGPSGPALRRIAGPSVRFLGSTDRSTILRRLPGYTGLVIPSRWVEGLPTVLLEALAAGVPCLSVAGSGAADVVDADGAGIVLARDASVEEWSAAVTSIAERRDELSRAARSSYEQRFTASHWLTAVHDLYAYVGTAVPVGG